MPFYSLRLSDMIIHRSRKMIRSTRRSLQALRRPPRGSRTSGLPLCETMSELASW